MKEIIDYKNGVKPSDYDELATIVSLNDCKTPQKTLDMKINFNLKSRSQTPNKSYSQARIISIALDSCNSLNTSPT